MTAQEKQISRFENELNGARRDLRETMSAVNAKVEHAEDQLRPDRLIEQHPVGASCVAGALGFLVGSSANRRIAGPLMIVALLGYAISRSLSKDWSREDDGETLANH